MLLELTLVGGLSGTISRPAHYSSAMRSPPPATVAALLQEAVAFHQQGQLAQAKALYSQVLATSPAQFDAVHMLGVIARQEGQADLAVALIGDAVAIEPANASAHCNLGAAYQAAGRPAEAVASYDRAIALDPRYALAYSNRGNALRSLGRLDEAMLSYRRALQIRPDYAEAWCNSAIALNDLGEPEGALDCAGRALQCRPAYADAQCARGNALQSLERFEEAADSYASAIALRPGDAELHCCLGTALQRMRRFDDALGSYDRAIALRPAYAAAHQFRANSCVALGREQEAVAGYRQALALGGDADAIGFALAALGEAAAPAGAPAHYVKALFDQYAGHFDEHLVGVLAYRTPAVLDAALERHALREGADTLELGCGTGLFGPYLRPRSRSLAGVDLSSRMLDKARARGLYDELACADIGAFLSSRRACYDLVAAADVLVYFGDLAPLFAQVHAALRPGGMFCFSAEACEGEGFGLQASQRYAHSLAYLQAAARQAGFGVVQAEPLPVRLERGAEVMGFAVVLLKP